MPHNSLKGKNVYDVISLNPASSVYVLQCSTPFQNIVKNNDPYTHSQDGKGIDSAFLIDFIDFGIMF